MELATTPPLSPFVELARGFCAWCEAPSLGADAESLASRWIARLHAAALELPVVACENDGEPDLDEPAFTRAKNNLAAFNGWYYRDYFDPDPTLTDESGMGDVGDDLLDIYKDIKLGLLQFESGDANDAFWHWSFLHKIHWGRHAVGALTALHCMHLSKAA
jgi:hypothetical protein